MTKRLVLVVLAQCVLGAAGYGYTAAEYNQRGIEAYNSKDFTGAIEHFEAALQVAPDHATVRRNLANARQGAADALARESLFADAVRHLERAIAVDPGNPSPLVQLGAYYLRLDMVPEAVFRLEEAVELRPGHLDAHELLGEAYYRDNDLPWARRQWEYVLQKDPSRKELQERYEKAFREEAVEAGFKNTSSRHFRLSGARDLPYPVRNRVLNMLETAYRDIGRELGGIYPPGPVQVILYDAGQFEQATQLDRHVGAVYDGKIRVPITGDTGDYLPEDELNRRLAHEYVHVVVRYIAGDNVPWWLNEGLAEMLSAPFEPNQRALLHDAYERGLAFKLQSLETSQLQQLGPARLRRAYLQARATVEHLWQSSGQRRMHDMLSRLAAGEQAEDALINSFRRDYRMLEREVAELFRR